MRARIGLIGVVALIADCARVTHDAPSDAPRCSATDSATHDRPLQAERPLDRAAGDRTLDQKKLDAARERVMPDAYVDRYLRFATTGDYVRLDAGMDWGADFTVALRIRLATLPGGYKDFLTCFMYDGNSLSGWEFGFENSAKLRWWIVNHDNDPWNNRCDAVAGQGLTLGAWHRIAFTVHYTSNSLDSTLYVNGVAVTTSSVTECQKTMVPGPLPVDAFRIGGMDTVQLDADDLRVFSRSLTGPEVAALNTGTVPTGLVLYWNMNEGSGTTLNDSSGHGRTGTILKSSWQTH